MLPHNYDVTGPFGAPALGVADEEKLLVVEIGVESAIRAPIFSIRRERHPYTAGVSDIFKPCNPPNVLQKQILDTILLPQHKTSLHWYCTRQRETLFFFIKVCFIFGWLYGALINKSYLVK